MLKQLAIKELRESLGLAALAVLGMTWAVSRLMGFSILSSWTGSMPSQDALAFINDGFTSFAAMFVGGVAIALGLKQSAWEHGRGTYHFLLHRPISRRSIIGTKLVVGTLLIISILAGSILLYGRWVSIPGNRAAPFEWSMSMQAWKQAVVLPIVYLGAFLSGMRPGLWFGTRLVPLAGAILWAMFANLMPAWWLFLPIVLLGYVCLLAAIAYYTETRDF